MVPYFLTIPFTWAKGLRSNNIRTKTHIFLLGGPNLTFFRYFQ